MSKTGLRQIRLDPDKYGNRESMAEMMKKELHFPESFRGNLDALSDLLSEVSQETVFEVDAGLLERYAQDPFSVKLLRVISDAAQENPHLHLYLV